MADPAKKQESPRVASNDNSESSSDLNQVNAKIKGRQSRELVIGLCGPIGSGIHSVGTQLQRVLKDEGYEVFEIRLSRHIEEFCNKAATNIVVDSTNRAHRYRTLMDAGDKLRENFGGHICANIAIAEIALLREELAKGESGNKTIGESKEAGLNKRAYIIDQLKHPDEVRALKGVYKNIFYLIGVLCDEQRRETSLTTEGIDRAEAHTLIMRDKKDNFAHGQQLEKTLYDADFFINNTDPNSSSVAALFERFLKLVHGGRSVTPTQQEVGMYAAYSASMQSACLSRQVGAAILDDRGALLATGRNDVPKFGGGLYSEDDHVSPLSKDYRCIHRDQRCHNDMHKLLLKDKIKEVISGYINDSTVVDAIADDIHSKTPIKSLIEYSRAIHAEMDALISVSRSDRSVSSGSTLYTTTYPCHNCARHIIAAGIEKIVYIEPYEKSLALKLHDDAMCHSDNPQKVRVVPFQGIAPRRYQVFFSNIKPEKDRDGRIILTDRDDQLQVDEESLDSYIERELKVAEAVLKETGI
ncbi:anti-phage dCTP deaminase [Marinobacter fonticola]|uniref:anti-phage dCTP deaminase n=1 Tax=Marinobacter fonticola TaxID=2603215 RepID=UPI0011E81729|nr:anti-phage dCTP deaminase [Marinobacter fonticola]